MDVVEPIDRLLALVGLRQIQAVSIRDRAKIVREPALLEGGVVRRGLDTGDDLVRGDAGSLKGSVDLGPGLLVREPIQVVTIDVPLRVDAAV